MNDYIEAARDLGISIQLGRSWIKTAELEEYFDRHVKTQKEVTQKIMDTLNPDLDILFSYVSERDDRFERKPIHVGSYYQGLKIRRSDEFDFTLLLKLKAETMTLYEQLYFDLAARGYRIPGMYGFDGHDTDTERKAHTAPQKLADGRQTITHNTIDKSLKIVSKVGVWNKPLDHPGLGYSHLTSLDTNSDTYRFLQRRPSLVFGGDTVPYLVKCRLKELMEEAINSCKFQGQLTLSPCSHGPALTLKYKHPSKEINFPISIDVSPGVIKDDTLKKSGIMWPPLESLWPPSGAQEAVQGKRLLLVAKQNFYWRLSFVELEKELCHHCDSDGGCRKKVHRLMKSFHQKYWHPGTNPTISSYIVKVKQNHLKDKSTARILLMLDGQNVWMLEMEKFPYSRQWAPHLLNLRLRDCIRSLIDYVDGYCCNGSSLPQYFYREDNLLNGKDVRQLFEELNVIRDFYYNPGDFI